MKNPKNREFRRARLAKMTPEQKDAWTKANPSVPNKPSKPKRLGFMETSKKALSLPVSGE